MQAHASVHRASIASLLILGSIVAFGLSGFAGNRSAQVLLSNDDLLASLTLPSVARAGQILETRFRLVAQKDIAKLSLGIDPELWRDLTTNSMVPEPRAQGFERGLLVFDFGKLDRGAELVLQISQQVNPGMMGVNRGRVVFFDGQRPLGQLSVELRVFP